MRKILPLLLVVVVFLTPLYPIYAQNGATPSDAAMNAPLYAVGTASASGRLRPAVMQKKIEDRMEKLDDRMMALKEKMASRAGELRKKLDKFKDKTKAARVENINSNLNKINERRTVQMQTALERISQVLNKLKTKTEEAGSKGKDVAAINKAISDAEALWKEADAAVKAQMEKDYSIVVNTEATVKSDASLARDSLRTDLKTVHTQLVETRQALANAIKTALSSIKGGTNNGSN